MIQEQTYLTVADNSGGRSVQCIKVLGGSGRKIARAGDQIVVVVKTLRSQKRFQRGSIHHAVVVRTKPLFSDNAVVILNKKKEPLGTRVGPVSSALYRQGYLKILAMAKRVV